MDAKPRKFVTRKRIPCNEGVASLIAANRPALNFSLSGTDGFIVGRADIKTNYNPDIDLGPFQALEHGMSRRHAALVRYQNSLHIVDLGSINGTYLNGERLPSDMPQPLHIGDVISFGELKVTIDYNSK